jgi:nucleotide-binding universal stress UspA family protein
MKILIAYDGSNCADAALDDLCRAGLPREAEVVVLSVADVYLLPRPMPPSDEKRVRTAFDEQTTAARQQARAQAEQAVADARLLAIGASKRVQALFPVWDVHAEACADSPAWGIIKKVDEWQPDLVVVGTHGHSALGRFLFGSVSQKVVTEARCTIRIARGGVADNTSPVHLVIGVDGSPDADAALRTVTARVWPRGSEARMIAVLDQAMATAVQWHEEGVVDAREGVQKIVETAAAQLHAAGLTVSSAVKEGDPKRVLIEEAEQWGADCLFVGARGLRRLERFLLGSVSTAVAARAHCSVEVVHPRQIP